MLNFTKQDDPEGFLGFVAHRELSAALIRRLVDWPPKTKVDKVGTARAAATAPKIDDVVPLIQPKQKSEARPEAEAKPISPPKPHAAFMDDRQ